MRIGRFFFILLSFQIFSSYSPAQTNTGGLSGTVLDQTSGVLANAEVTIEQESTSEERVAHTNGLGQFSVPELPPGQYQITVRLAGFETVIRQGISVSVGQEAVVDIALKVGSSSSEVTVTADAELVDTRSAAVSGLMDNQSIQELPLNGRDVYQLALLEPGVVMLRRTSDSGGNGTKLVVNGSRPTQNSFLLDGSDINDAYDQTPGSATGVMLGVDTLREFRVLSNSYSAEYGRSAGGIISAVTKSGTNQFHGSVFEFIRNSDVDAKNFFDSHTAPIPPFKRNQFGGEVDGPVSRDKTFFMAAYEGLRQRLGVTSIAVVPGADARLGNLPGQPPITVAPSVPGYLSLIPLPNGPMFSDGTGQYINQASRPTNENFAAARLDHRLSDNTFLFARYTYDGALALTPDTINLSSSNMETRNQYLTGQITHIFSERLLDTFSFSFNKSLAISNYSFLSPVDPSLSFLPGDPLGYLNITGLFSTGVFSYGTLNMKLFEFSDNAAYARGRHSLNIGGDFRFYHFPEAVALSPYGMYAFNSLSDFLQANPSSVQFTLPSSNVQRNWRQSMFDAYVQDEIRMTQRLTLNLGLRYERISEPSEENGLLTNLRSLLDPTETVGRIFVNPSNLNFAPRVGLASDPFGDGKTSIRSGFGIFYSELWDNDYYSSGNLQPPFYTLGSVSNTTGPIPFPNAYSLVGSSRFTIGRIDVLQYKPNSPYEMQYNFNVQRQVASRSVVTVGYTGERGIHILSAADGNQALPVTCPNPACPAATPAGTYYFPVGSTVQNPNFTGIRYKRTAGQTYYNGLQVSFEQRFTKGLSLRLNYTFSRDIDDGQIENTGNTDDSGIQDPYNTRAERGLSSFDIKNYFVAYWDWALPSLPGPKSLGSGWHWNAITTLASGAPFTAIISFDQARALPQVETKEYPNLVPGRSNDPILGDPAKYFDPSAFALQPAGFYGNLGRNTLIGPGLVKVDFSLNKQFAMTERMRLELRAEAFNFFNHPNFSIPSSRTVFSGVNAATGQGIPVASAGLITTTQTTSRQLQLGLKLTF